MKPVDRTRVNRPPSLAPVNSPATREFARAQHYYSTAQEKAYKFTVYKADDVKEALEALFDKHCAYCESYFGATQPEDVEHYRPKGGVLEDASHPGYWWLAADWDNLLSSCIDCNRTRSHQVLTYDENTGAINTVQDSGGKGESFPVFTNRARGIGDEVHEVPLLICPTVEDPSQFIKFDVIQEFVLVSLVESGVPLTKLKGEATIKCFGLNRQGLVEKRTKLAIDIKFEFALVERVLDKAVKQDDDEVRAILIQTALEQLTEIETKISMSKEYSVFAIEYAKSCKASLIDKYQSLL